MTEQQPVDLQTKIRHMSDSELQQFTGWIIGERYRVQAEKTGIQMPKGDFLPVDGQKIRSFWDEEGTVIPSGFDPEEIEKRLPQIGQYKGNDGAITFVGPDGRYWVGLQSENNMQALKEAGYQGGLQVNTTIKNIMNADCQFVDPQLQKQWEQWGEEPYAKLQAKSLIQPKKKALEYGDALLEEIPPKPDETAESSVSQPLTPEQRQALQQAEALAQQTGTPFTEQNWTETASVATPIIEDWQSQLRQMLDQEFDAADEGLSQSYNDFVQKLNAQGIQYDEIAKEEERYVEERKKSAATSSIKENTGLAPTLAPVIPVVPYRQEITLGREVIGTSPEGLINSVNQILTKSASSEISFSSAPRAVIDYLETIELPYGAKIKEANTQIRGDQLSIVGSVSVPAMGDVKFNAILAPDSTGRLTITSHKVETSLRLRLMKGKIENGIACLDQKMAEKINQKVDPRWEYAGFRIAGNQLALDFKKK